MSPDEHNQIVAISRKLDEFRSATERRLDVMNTKLFGEPDGTEREGRLPRCEKRLDAHGDRLVSLETFRTRFMGAYAAVAVIVALVLMAMRVGILP